ncbi:MAG: iron-sulfur cluster assembly scaffold protein [Chloroflexota bacterium]
MDRQEQLEFILDHYENPRNRGPLASPDIVMKGGNPGCGDIVTLYVRLDGDERISQITFEGEGCTISQAAASMLTELALGKSLAEVEAMNAADFVEALGREIVINRLRCATLALNTLKAAEKKYRVGQRARSAAEAEVENF